MKREEFDLLINLYSSTRGPKPKSDTVEGAFLVITGSKGSRYQVRLADKVLELKDKLSKKDSSLLSSFNIYCDVNNVLDGNNKHAVWMSVSKGYTPSYASSLAGAYSAQVYSMYRSLIRFHETRLKWEAVNGRSNNS